MKRYLGPWLLSDLFFSDGKVPSYQAFYCLDNLIFQYYNMIRRPSYKEFLNQTIQSSHKTLYPTQNIPSNERPPPSSYRTKITTLPDNKSKDYTHKNSSLAQTLLKIPNNPSSMRQTEGYTRFTSDKK